MATEEENKRSEEFEKRRLELLKEQRKERVEAYVQEKRSLEIQSSLTEAMQDAVRYTANGVEMVVGLGEEAKKVQSDIISGYESQQNATAALKAIDEQRLKIGRGEHELQEHEVALVLKQLQNAEGLLVLERERQIALQITKEKQEQLEQVQKDLADSAKSELDNLTSEYTSTLNSIPGGGLLGKMLGGGMAAAGVGLAILSILKFSEQNKKIREDLGVSATHAEALNRNSRQLAINMENVAGNADDVREAQAAIATTFMTTAMASDKVLTDMVALNKTFGVAAETSAQVARTFQEMGESVETSMDLQFFTANLAKAAKVAPGEVMKDIAQSAELAHKFFQGNVKELAKQAIEARRLGLSLADIEGAVSKTLDIEGSLSSEMEAQVMLGREINFDRARQLLLQGDMVGAMDTMLDQLGGIDQFNKMDLLQKEAAANALGLSVQQLGTALTKQSEIAMLSKADREEIEQARLALEGKSTLNAEEIKQRELQAIQQEKMAAATDRMLLALQETFVPVMQDILGFVGPIVSGFGTVFGFLMDIKPLAFALVGIMSALAIKSMISAVAGIYTTLAAIPFGLGLVGAAGVVGALIGGVSMVTSSVQSAEVGGEVMDDGIANIHTGETIVTKEISDAVKAGGLQGGDNSVIAQKLDQLIASVSQPVQVKLGNTFVNEVDKQSSFNRSLTMGLDNTYGNTL